ncbi:MAG: hypothetical protein JWN30_780 [Bacilli bacterium]|nr:hypothetical protein [Bacilli bacterium]
MNKAVVAIFAGLTLAALSNDSMHASAADLDPYGNVLAHSGSSGSAAAGFALGDRAVGFGAQYRGVPYVWGGSTPSGFDCSGFVQYVYQHLGVSLPRTAASMYSVGSSVSRNSLQIGDLVFFTTYCPGASHVGIYAGEGQFLSATSKGVTYSSLTNSYWNARYVGAKRIY